MQTVVIPDGYTVILQNYIWGFLITIFVLGALLAMTLFLLKWTGAFSVWIPAKQGRPVAIRHLHEGGVQINTVKKIQGLEASDLAFTVDGLPLIKTTGIAGGRSPVESSKSGIKWLDVYSLQAFLIPPEMPFEHAIWQYAYGFTAGAPEAELFNYYVAMKVQYAVESAGKDPKTAAVEADTLKQAGLPVTESVPLSERFTNMLNNTEKSKVQMVYGKISLYSIAEAVKTARNMTRNEDLAALMEWHCKSIQYYEDPYSIPTNRLPAAFYSPEGLWCHVGGFINNWAIEKQWHWVNLRPDAVKRGMSKGAQILFDQATAFTKYGPVVFLALGLGGAAFLLAMAMKIMGLL